MKNPILPIPRRSGRKILGPIAGLALLISLGTAACSSGNEAPGPDSGRTAGPSRKADRRLGTAGFRSEYSRKSRAAYIRLQEYQARERRGDSFTEDEAREYRILAEIVKRRREQRGTGREEGGRPSRRRSPRPTREEMDSLREIQPPQKTGPGGFREKIEDIEKKFGEEKARELRRIFIRFMQETRKIRETWSDSPGRLREEIHRLAEKMRQEADAYIQSLEKDKRAPR